MGKTIIVSNRMATSVSRTADGFAYSPSVGGLATGLSSLHAQENSLWIGWSGLPSDSLTEDERESVFHTLLHEHKSVPVDLSQDEIDAFYLGFCNDIIWPLFHYFPTYPDYDPDLWDAYVAVNEKFFASVSAYLEPGDLVWVQDYQLMLLPSLIKEAEPEASVGFFLHIPFPSYELFRLLPWREQVLRGLLGSDLIGFHTYDYARHFLSSVRRLLGYDHSLANVHYENRLVRVDVFPMGIDYERYANATSQPEVRKEYERIRNDMPAQKMILSVDRLDYTKGIPQRLRAYEQFLATHREFHGEVSLILIVAPSRTAVPRYQELKREVDELVSVINGRFASIAWTPIHYFFRTFSFTELSALYAVCDVLLVTALRDGMNLIAKEYVAARRDQTGSIVVTETAGVAREMSEAIIVNPSSVPDIAEGLARALEMPVSEQHERMGAMQRRIERYDIHYWANDFVEKLRSTAETQSSLASKQIRGSVKSSLVARYRKAKRRLVLLDYDGTLVPYMDRPELAVPDSDVRDLIARLASDEKNDVVVISSRGRDFLERHLGDLPIGLMASHGVWTRKRGGEWEQSVPVGSEWKADLTPIMQLHADRTPGSRYEEKEYSIAWHYRGSDPDLASVRVAELYDALMSMSSNLSLEVFEGNRVLEVKSALASKAQAAATWHGAESYDLILAAGDDQTDEELFQSLPDNAESIRLGLSPTNANYFVESPRQLRSLLSDLSETDV